MTKKLKTFFWKLYNKNCFAWLRVVSHHSKITASKNQRAQAFFWEESKVKKLLKLSAKQGLINYAILFHSWEKISPHQEYFLNSRAEFCLMFRSFFGQWNFKKKCWLLGIFSARNMFWNEPSSTSSEKPILNKSHHDCGYTEVVKFLPMAVFDKFLTKSFRKSISNIKL